MGIIRKALGKILKGVLVVPAVWDGMKNAGKNKPKPEPRTVPDEAREGPK